jgi:PII-like signaling protein
VTGALANSPPAVLQSFVTYRSLVGAARRVCKGGIAMLQSGNAVKVSIYLSDGAKHHGIPVYTSLLDFIFHNGIYGATVLKGVAGFGSTHRIHSAHILEISDHLPIKIEFIETREKVDEILPELEKRTGCGLIEIQETTVIIPARQ